MARPAPVDVGHNIGFVRRFFAQVPDENINFGGLKAGNGDIEVRLDREFLQLERQEVTIPTGELGQPVVGNHIRPDLCRRQVVNAHRRNVPHAEQLCSLDPAVASDDAVRAVDQDRINKAKFLDTGSNLLDLTRRVGAWIAVTAPKLGRILIGHFEGWHNPNLPGLPYHNLLTTVL